MSCVVFMESNFEDRSRGPPSQRPVLGFEFRVGISYQRSALSETLMAKGS